MAAMPSPARAAQDSPEAARSNRVNTTDRSTVQPARDSQVKDSLDPPPAALQNPLRRAEQYLKDLTLVESV